MIELFVLACLADDLNRCQDVSLVFDADAMTPMQCMMAAPIEIAKWAEGHPKWVAKRWTCRPAGRQANI